MMSGNSPFGNRRVWLFTVVGIVFLSVVVAGAVTAGSSTTADVQEASITVNDQNITGETIGVEMASADEEFVAVVYHDDEVIGESVSFEAGTVDGFPINLDTELTEDTSVEVALYDSDGEERLDEASDTAELTVVEGFIEMADQSTDGTTLEIEAAGFSEEAWGVHVHRMAGGGMGEILGTSESFEAGESVEDVTLELEQPITETQTMMAMLHYAPDEGDDLDDLTMIEIADGQDQISALAFVEVEPEPMLSVNDQRTTGEMLGIDMASADEDFVAVAYEDGEELGESVSFEAGVVDGFPINLMSELSEDTTVEVALYDEDGEERLVDAEGNEVSETVEVTVIEGFVEMEQQSTDGTTLEIEAAGFSEEAWGVHVHKMADGGMGEIMGISENFEAGETVENVTLEMETPIEETQSMMAMLHHAPEEGDDFDDLEMIEIADGQSQISTLAFVEVERTVEHYADEDGEVQIQGVSEAIDDWRAGEIEVGLVSDVIDAWRSG